MYAESNDPWSFNARWYERRKRALTVASLPHERYHRAFEPGSSIGALTRELAEHCDFLLAWEGAPAAVEQAKRALVDLEHVHLAQGRVPWEWPEGDFDLIVLSELLYYFDDADLAAILARSVDSLRPEGTLVAVHWQHQVEEHVRSGENAHAALAASPRLHHVVGHVEADFLLDVYTVGSGPARSVAESEGLV